MGCEKNIEASIMYYKLASKNGNALASFNLGVIFEKGFFNSICFSFPWILFKYLGPQQHFQESIYYYQMACEQGNDYAYLNLGLIYFYGNGVKKDKKKAYASHAAISNLLFIFFIL